ncbi:MAG: hypothetical protein ACOC2U_00035 [bacterium]
MNEIEIGLLKIDGEVLQEVDYPGYKRAKIKKAEKFMYAIFNKSKKKENLPVVYAVGFFRKKKENFLTLLELDRPKTIDSKDDVRAIIDFNSWETIKKIFDADNKRIKE